MPASLDRAVGGRDTLRSGIFVPEASFARNGCGGATPTPVRDPSPFPSTSTRASLAQLDGVGITSRMPAERLFVRRPGCRRRTPFSADDGLVSPFAPTHAHLRQPRWPSPARWRWRSACSCSGASSLVKDPRPYCRCRRRAEAGPQTATAEACRLRWRRDITVIDAAVDAALPEPYPAAAAPPSLRRRCGVRGVINSAGAARPARKRGGGKCHS